jgi:hypothetical protein
MRRWPRSTLGLYVGTPRGAGFSEFALVFNDVCYLATPRRMFGVVARKYTGGCVRCGSSSCVWRTVMGDVYQQDYANTLTTGDVCRERFQITGNR